MTTKQELEQKRIEELQRKAEDAQRKAEAKERHRNESNDRFAEIIEKHSIYYLADRNRYVKFDKDDGWLNFEQAGLNTLYNINGPDEVSWFKECLHMANRVKTNAVNTFRPCPDSKLNTLSTERWLQPEEGKVEDIFNILFSSLSGGRSEVRDHIEQCFVWKYCHPEDYLLPCITISGEGGVGKNELIERVFGTIFGEQQVASIGTKEAFGAFNGQMLGKTVVFIDEAITDKVDTESLKRSVGNKTLQVNVKYGLQGTFDNTPWYWLGGNGTNGTVLLAGDTTDRRYSVITVSRNLMYWVGQHIGMEVEGRGQNVLASGHPCVTWWKQNSKYLSNPKAVSAWLYSVLKKWGSQEFCPSAFHDDDYREVMESQKSVFTLVMESVFEDPDFRHIEKTTLYRVYELMNKRDNPRGGVLAAKKFHADAKHWLDVNNTGIDLHERINVKKPGGMMTTSNVYSKMRQTVDRNNQTYIGYDEDRRVDVLVEKSVKAVKEGGGFPDL